MFSKVSFFLDSHELLCLHLVAAQTANHNFEILTSTEKVIQYPFSTICISKLGEMGLIQEEES